jgi:hypothetical protein
MKSSRTEGPDMFHPANSAGSLKDQKAYKRTSISNQILELLNERPYARSDIIESIHAKEKADKKTSENTIDSELVRLRRKKAVKKIPIQFMKEIYPDYTKKNDQVAYALYSYESEEHQIKKLMLTLREGFLYFRWPSVEEIAINIGKKPEYIREIVYKIAPSIIWNHPTEDDEKFTKISLRIYNTYLINKFFVENTKLINGKLILSNKIKSLFTSSNKKRIRTAIPPDSEVKASYVEPEELEARTTKEEWEELQRKSIWKPVRGKINELLPEKNDKNKYGNWLEEKLNSIEIIEHGFFKTILNIIRYNI